MYDIEHRGRGLQNARYLDYRHATREDWLMAAADLIGDRLYRVARARVPGKLRVAVGFPSAGRGSNTVAECWYSHMAADGTTEIWIAPQYDRPADLLHTLAHELCHAALGPGFGHGREFARLGASLGLLPPWPASGEGEPFAEFRRRQLEPALGEFPHGRHLLTPSATLLPAGEDTPRARPRCRHPDAKPQTNRMMKVACPACGYVARVARKWLVEAGAPICPTDGVALAGADALRR